MDSERWKKLEVIFHSAIELPNESRTAYLADACRDDCGMYSEIVELLGNDRLFDALLESSAIEVAAASLSDELLSSDSRPSTHGSDVGCLGAQLKAGEMIGDFRIAEKIGEGGMGEVYVATDLKLDRTVAVKLLPRFEASDDERSTRLLLREARASSALNHPNIVNIHAIERASERDFIVMEFVDGETLRDRISRGTLSIAETLTITAQLADALRTAHAAGIIHSDLKPANILINREGVPKVVDFGIARRINEHEPATTEKIGDARAEATGTGFVVGSPAYMSPEQIRCEKLDGRSDIFSLGSITYEMITGKRPFVAESSLAMLYDVLNVDPPLPSTLRPEIPASVDRLIERMLSKDRGRRFSSAAELSDAIATAASRFAGTRPWKRRLKFGALTAAIALLGLVLWLLSVPRQEWITGGEELAANGRYFEAFQTIKPLGLEAVSDPRLLRLLSLVSDTISVNTEPSGASVYLTSFTESQQGKHNARVLLGKTPIIDELIARDDYVLDIELDGYSTVRRSVSTRLSRIENAVLGDPKLARTAMLVERNGKQSMFFDAPAPIKIQQRLISKHDAHDGMVLVPGGEYKLVSYGRPTDQKVNLADFFIDKCEVTNREFKEFVDAGGYLDDRFWKHGVTGRNLTDRTGLPGPRSWSNQNYPDGMAEHPVTSVSLHEAAAYAEFRGKKLPTVFQWEKAARDGRYTHTHMSIMPWGAMDGNSSVEGRANFFGNGPMPVDSFEFGTSVYGAYNMAGNVSEWLANPIADGYGTAGGSWKDAPYLFANFGTFPGKFTADTVGFRCVTNMSDADQGSFAIDLAGNVPMYALPERATVTAMERLYLYDKTDLRAEIVETSDAESWRRETIRFQSAGEEVVAYLYIPKGVSTPVQTIVYVPSGAVKAGLTVTQEIEAHAAPYIKSGRAVFSVVLPGYRERPRVASAPDLKSGTIAFRDFIVDSSIDLRRGVDYLETRQDVDMKRLACMGVSVSNEKLTLLAVEARCRAVVMIGAGLVRRLGKMMPEANGMNLVGQMSRPKLMVHGRYDEVVPWLAEGQPLYRLLPQPKSLVLLDQGHVPPVSASVPAITRWLDQTLGSVQR
ncbi:MAG: SUMF1/EgtB/PvdO family nonheme iron enzyme [Acidobacteriota bacterium]